MKKFLPWLLGAFVGALLATSILGILALMNLDRPKADPAYRLVAVSWGDYVKQDYRWPYQVQVIASKPDMDGVVNVTARVCIRGSDHFRNMGFLGTAANMGEASRRFGSISWLEDRVTVGGDDGLKASLLRAKLDKHR
jgi:hypothetical protein